MTQTFISDCDTCAMQQTDTNFDITASTIVPQQVKRPSVP
jgi:hypothetical protein